MKWLGPLIFLLSIACSAFGQGVRMSADFLPLAVGNQWVYDIVGEDGRKLKQVEFSVREHTILKGRSFYVLSGFPFVLEGGDQIHLVRYDRQERQFVRMLGDEEGPLFLSDGATTEVTESDSSGLPMKFVLHTSSMAITFQRGVGIVEVRLQSGSGIQTAKVASARVGEGVAPPAAAGGAPAADKPQSPSEAAGIPLPKTPEQKAQQRVDNVGSITDDNPLLVVDAGEVPEGHKFVLTVKNVSDKLLPFSFQTGQSYDFAVLDAASGQEVWRWSRHMFFVSSVKRTEAITPQHEWQFEVTWNHRDDNLDPVPPGTYKVVGFVSTNPVLESDPITIELK